MTSPGLPMQGRPRDEHDDGAIGIARLQYVFSAAAAIPFARTNEVRE